MWGNVGDTISLGKMFLFKDKVLSASHGNFKIKVDSTFIPICQMINNKN
jgi:hypothetical protein